MAESDVSGVTQKEYIYFAGRRVAFRSVPTDTPYYYFSDHLGSANVITNGSGSSIQVESDFFPFGGERVITNLINNRYEFTGKEQDTASEGGLTHFLFREYTTNLGRFMTPDLLAGSIGDPQSLNRYAYVLNNPLNLVDPLGLQDSDAREARSDARRGRLEVLAYGTRQHEMCSLNGSPIACFSVMRLAQMGVVVNCPQCNGTGIVVGNDNHLYGGWGPRYGLTPCVGTSAADASCSGATMTLLGFGPLDLGPLPQSQTSLWDFCGSRCMNWLAGFGNFSAGAGDFLSFNLTEKARKMTDSNQFVDKNSGAYTAGFVTGVGITAAGGALGAGKAIAGLETKIAIHGANHTFRLIGQVPHLQVMWWLAGVSGSGQALRFPLTPWWP